MSHILFPRPALRFGFASLTFTTRWAGEQTQHPLYHGQETQKIVTNPFQDLTRSRDNPVSVVTRIGKNQSVGKVYPQNDPLVEKIAAIMASGVFDLPTENRKAERAGKDLAQVKIVYRDGHSGKTIIRDYRWGETFESSFHEAEKLFAEIVKMVGSAKP